MIAELPARLALPIRQTGRTSVIPGAFIWVAAFGLLECIGECVGAVFNDQAQSFVSMERSPDPLVAEHTSPRSKTSFSLRNHGFALSVFAAFVAAYTLLFLTINCFKTVSRKGVPSGRFLAGGDDERPCTSGGAEGGQEPEEEMDEDPGNDPAFQVQDMINRVKGYMEQHPGINAMTEAIELVLDTRLSPELIENMCKVAKNKAKLLKEEADSLISGTEEGLAVVQKEVAMGKYVDAEAAKRTIFAKTNERRNELIADMVLHEQLLKGLELKKEADKEHEQRLHSHSLQEAARREVEARRRREEELRAEAAAMKTDDDDDE